jgi:hypothetical protein
MIGRVTCDFAKSIPQQVTKVFRRYVSVVSYRHNSGNGQNDWPKSGTSSIFKLSDYRQLLCGSQYK